MKNIGSTARAVAISAFALTTVLAAPAAAATVSFENVRGAWSNAIGSSATYTNNDSANAQVRWGVPQGYGQSGYNFIGSDFGPISVNSPYSSGAFTMGEFQHLNFPISSGTSITGITLLFTAEVIVDNVNLGDRTFTYNFTHFETPNQGNSCANGGANNSGINVNGCADRVTMNFNASSDTFMIGADTYTLDIAGFLVGGNPSDGFWTKEQASNSAFIQGKINLYSLAAGVPEPSTWAMMIIGFGGVGTMVRSNRRRNAFSAV